MPFFKVYVGYGIADTAAANILANGIPSEIYPIPVRVINAIKMGSDQTLFEIEAGDETVANEWSDALSQALDLIEEYTPVPPENPDPPPDPLDVWTRVGTWTKSVAGGTTTISSLPSNPRGLVLWGSGLSGATIGSFSDAGTVVFGFSDGTNQSSLSHVAQDNVTPSNTQRGLRDDSTFFLVDPTATTAANHVLERGTVSFGSSAFTITWNATTLATQGFYFVFGGNDITEVLVKQFDAGAADPTPAQVTYTGVGFQSDFGLFLTASSTTALPFASAFGNTSISAHATNTNSRIWSTVIRTMDNTDVGTNMRRYQAANKILSNLVISTNTVDHYATFKGWTADGFILNWPNPPTSSSTKICALLVKGGNWDAGSFIQPITTGEVTTLVSYSTSLVQGIMGFSVGAEDMSNGSTGATPAKLVVGAQDDTGNKACVTYSGTTVTSPNPMIEATGMFSDRFIKNITSASTASSSTTDAQCTVTDMATDGKFTVNYTTADSTARQVVWFTLSA